MRLSAWLMLLLLGAAAATATAAEDAEAWAKRTIDQGFALLRDDTGGTTARRARFHAFIVNHVEARKSALFALGVYRRGADPAAIEEYAAVFSDYSIEIYESRLENYKDATLSVTGSIENRPGDITVNTLGSAPRLREPARIAFRLQGAGGTFKITDVQVEGIWLSIELRDEFNALLGANGGDLRALTRTLVTRTNNLRTGNSQG
jgi:phospholipid transport system substrate-binding protein